MRMIGPVIFPRNRLEERGLSPYLGPFINLVEPTTKGVSVEMRTRARNARPMSETQALPNSAAEGRDTRHGGHHWCTDRDPGNEDGVEQARHDAVLIRVGASRNERRRRGEHETVTDTEKGHQDEEHRQVSDERNTGHRDGDS